MTAQADRFEEAGRLVRAQEFDGAFALYLELAREGVPEAQAMVAEMLSMDPPPVGAVGAEAAGWDLDVEAAAWDLIAVLNECAGAGDIYREAAEDAAWLDAARNRAAALRRAYPACSPED